MKKTYSHLKESRMTWKLPPSDSGGMYGAVKKLVGHFLEIIFRLVPRHAKEMKELRESRYYGL